ncbi:nucleoside diphosphate-linked moiety X motif 13-like [Pollicipes pollicipes]|uniref:nucleoside diphosphate-linked moiety X motif 13-like n=1 Tax=Pollicipes pollicipes TaxID=41117 RepID=UPI0018852E7B|nr:nucleoside diphosphate-linked moiety X motif 13-like [Pollicipes pollicipes]XP_037084464.1 nucleoside diphosphate-linked moiety X motif 13-like [Pollicipes pollicipes]
MISFKQLLSNCVIPSSVRGIFRNSSTLSYVQRIKLLQAAKDDDSKCSEMMERGLFLPFLNKRPLINIQSEDLAGKQMNSMEHGSQKLRWITFSELQSLCPWEDVASRAVLLHIADSGQACFTAALPGGADVAAQAETALASKFVDPRAALFLLPWAQAHTMSHAFAVLHWKAVTNFCPNCGVELRSRTAGHAKRCPSCETVQYPVTPPVGITMVTDTAQTRALLVRQGRHPPGMYSCVAGFLEPGETIESCVRREVAEEVGLDVHQIRYAGSQHWPFDGSSLMVGCYALTDHTELEVDRSELEDARWFSASELLDAYQRIQRDLGLRLRRENTGVLWIPPRGTIAHRLIKSWLAERGLLS